MEAYPTLKIVKAVLEEHGLAPKKRLGQNFLIDANIARKSLQLGHIEKADTVVEIGPGLGALTQLLLEAGCAVFAVEKDAGLFHYLESMLKQDRLQLMHGDAMNCPLASCDAAERDFKIVANLPYAISTPWLDAVLVGQLPSRMVLMLQKEAADRFMASAGTGYFGPISIFLKAAYDVEATHTVGSQCFYPKPEVGSVLLSLKLKDRPIVYPSTIKEGVRTIFRKRRKQISSILAKETLGEKFQAWLDELVTGGLSPETRPEAIKEDDWQRLADYY